MIHFLSGKPGGGKGLVAMTEIIRELTTGSRVILTDLPVRLHPWLRRVKSKSPWIPGSTDRFQPELGLLGYLQEKYGKTFEAEKRLRVIDDTEAKEFFLHRMQVATAEWIKMPHIRDDKGRVESFSTEIPTHGTLILMDECWRTFPAREWAKTGPGVIYYAAQHRHLGDEVFFICQHTKQVECALRDLAQDFWVTKNHSKLRIGFFRQPSIFTVNVYEKVNALTAMETRMFRIDKRGVGGCYDTAAGTGLVGGNAADLNEKPLGVPFPLLVAGIAVIMLLLWQSPNLMGMAARKVFTKTDRAAATAVTPPKASTLVPAEQSKPVVLDKVEPVIAVTNAVEFEGYTFDGRNLTVMLSDGSMKTVKGGMRRLDNGKWLVDGVEYAPRRVKPVEYVSPVLDLSPPSLPSVERVPPSVSVTIIGQRSEPVSFNQPLRENFFQNR